MRLSALVLALLLAAGMAAPAWTQDSMRAFGGGGDPAAQTTGQAGVLEAPGFVQRLLIDVRRVQRALQTKLADAVGAVRDGRGAWPVLVLIGLSFAYGVFHAAGPGHGKVVIASYLLAGDGKVRRGVVLAALAALLQAVSAVGLVGVLAIALGASNLATSDRVGVLETVSYGLVAALGLWLLWRVGREALGYGHVHHHHGPGGHDHGHGQLAKAASAGWREAAAVVLAVGIRPCSGAVIVLLFATAQGLFALGIAGALAMSVGTAITVSVLAAASVAVRRGAIRHTGQSARWQAIVASGLGFAGAAAVTAFGTVSLAATIAA